MSKQVKPYTPKGITLEQAKALRNGAELFSRNLKTGGPVRWRVTSVKTWKRDAGRIEIGIKHGLYTYDKLMAEHLPLVGLNHPED